MSVREGRVGRCPPRKRNSVVRLLTMGWNVGRGRPVDGTGGGGGYEGESELGRFRTLTPVCSWWFH